MDTVAVHGGKPPVWFWIVGVLALLWALAGCFAYLTQVNATPEQIAALPPAQQAIWLSMPAWVKGAYAIAVWPALIGAVALLLRRRWAQPLYIISLVGILAQFGWTFLATPILRTIGPSTLIFPAFIALVCAALIWFAGFASRRGWLR